MTVIQAILFAVLGLGAAAFLASKYRKTYEYMSNDRYWEPNDWYQTEPGMSDDRLFKYHKTQIQYIDPSQTEWR